MNTHNYEIHVFGQDDNRVWHTNDNNYDLLYFII